MLEGGGDLPPNSTQSSLRMRSPSSRAVGDGIGTLRSSPCSRASRHFSTSGHAAPRDDVLVGADAGGICGMLVSAIVGSREMAPAARASLVHLPRAMTRRCGSFMLQVGGIVAGKRRRRRARRGWQSQGRKSPPDPRRRAPGGFPAEVNAGFRQLLGEGDAVRVPGDEDVEVLLAARGRCGRRSHIRRGAHDGSEAGR